VRFRALVAAALLGLGLSACSTAAEGPNAAPTCDHGDVLILMAQSVPSATYIPCITEFPVGWTFGGDDIDARRSVFWLDSDRAGLRSVTVSLTRTCDVAGAVEVPVEPDEAGTTRFELPRSLPPAYVADRFYRFAGGCVTYHFAFQRGATFTQALEATNALTFFSRELGVRLLERQGLTLCGAGVTCPG
jgi:hypothetical protein